MAAAAILKNTKLAISQHRIGRSLRNLVWLCKIGLVTVKKFEFPKSKTPEAALLKTVKSPYLCNRLTAFDEIWHADPDWPPTGDRPLKFRIFQKKNKMAAVVILKNHTNRDITTRDWQIFVKFGMIMQNWSLKRPERKKLNFQNPRWPTLWKLLNRHISATVWPILMKFGKVTHIGPVHEIDR